MRPDAGFAAVVSVSDGVIDDMITAAYHSGGMPLTFDIAQEMPGLLTIAGSLFSGIPRVSTPATDRQRFSVELTAWGELTIALPAMGNGVWTLVPETRYVSFTATVTVRHVATIEGNELTIGIAPTSATLASYAFTVLSPTPFSQGAQSLLNSDLFRNSLEAKLQENMDGLNGAFRPMDLEFMDPLIGMTPPAAFEYEGTPLTEAVTRSCGGALTVGIDRRWGLYGSLGDPAQLANLTDGLSIVAWANPDLWTPAMEYRLRSGAPGEPGINDEITAQGGFLADFDLSLRNGYFRCQGLVYTGRLVDIDFSFRVYPRLVRPKVVYDYGYDEDGSRVVRTVPARDELWFEVTNVHVETDREAGLIFIEVLGGLLTAGLLIYFIESQLSFVRGVVASQIDARDTGAGNRVHSFELGEDGPIVTARIDRFEFHEEGVVMGLSWKTSFAQPRIRAISHSHPIRYSGNTIDVTNALRKATLVYGVILPREVHLEDPYLRIRWTLRNRDTNDILLQTDGAAAEHSTLAISDFANAMSLQLSCRVYRAIGTEITDFFNGTYYINFADRLDRNHPFVRWFHYVRVPDVRIEDDRTVTILGAHVTYRASRIHRTDFPGRCWMADRFSLAKPKGVHAAPDRRPRLEYMDALPFSGDWAAHRVELCDYCFFGGPNESRPRDLPD